MTTTEPTSEAPAKRKGKKPGRKRMTVAQKEQARIDREANKAQEEFEAVFLELPESANSARELNWVRNHPAMGLLDRMPPSKDGKPNRVILTREHISDAPSRAAVHSLQHWANNPADFQKGILSETKKETKLGSDGKFDEGGEKSELVKSIDQLLMSLDCAVDPAVEPVDGA